MWQKILVILPVLLLTLPVSTAQEKTNATIAILRFGGPPSTWNFTESKIVDALHAYGLVSSAEATKLRKREFLAGDKVTITWGDANWDLPNVHLIVNQALDLDADVLVTMTAPVTQVAIHATQDMDDPPAIFFTTVYNSLEAGIAQSTCIKPAHVTGAEVRLPYEDLMRVLLSQLPDITRIGLLHSSNESSGIVGADIIEEIAHEASLIVNAVTGVADVYLAVEGLFGKGVEALVLPFDSVTAQSLPVIAMLANENGIPVFYPSLASVTHGATFGAGFYLQSDQAINVGRLLVNYLKGNVDIATTRINVYSDAALGINLDSAAALGIAITPELLAEADALVENKQPRLSEEFESILGQSIAATPWEALIAADAAFIDSLRCTPEMIAEQQAQLDSASE